MTLQKLNPATTAVLVVDMQNDNLHADGAFASSGAADHAVQQGVVAHVAAILDAARATGTAVVHNQIVIYPGRPTGGANAPIFRMLGPESLLRGSWGASAVEGAEPQGDEIVLERIRMSGFHGTSLDTILRNLGITTVVVTGVWTNMAVEHTVRDAADYGYEAVIVSDATSSINAEWQAAALGFALQNIATQATTAEVIEALGHTAN